MHHFKARVPKFAQPLFQPTVCNLFPLSNSSALEINCKQPEHAAGVKLARSYRKESHQSSQISKSRSKLISKREFISKLYHLKTSYQRWIIYHIKMTAARHSSPIGVSADPCVILSVFTDPMPHDALRYGSFGVVSGAVSIPSPP